MIKKEKNLIEGSVISNDSPEEIFTEGFCDLIAYGDIVKFNIFSRPIHSKDMINSKKINKTLTFTAKNFEFFLDRLKNDYDKIISLQNDDQQKESIQIDNDNKIPPKGSRIV